MCEFIFTNSPPNQEQIGKYYASEEYISHSDSKKGIVNSIYHEIRKFSLGEFCAFKKTVEKRRTTVTRHRVFILYSNDFFIG